MPFASSWLKSSAARANGTILWTRNVASRCPVSADKMSGMSLPSVSVKRKGDGILPLPVSNYCLIMGSSVMHMLVFAHVRVLDILVAV